MFISFAFAFIYLVKILQVHLYPFMLFSADNLSSVVVTIIRTLSYSHIYSIDIIGYLTTMASSNIPHLIYCCIQYILYSITVNPLIKVNRLLLSASVLVNGNSNVLVALDVHCLTHIYLALSYHNLTHLLQFLRLIRIAGVSPEK